jgi:hypothetical protein
MKFEPCRVRILESPLDKPMFDAGRTDCTTGGLLGWAAAGIPWIDMAMAVKTMKRTRALFFMPVPSKLVGPKISILSRERQQDGVKPIPFHFP